MINVNANEGLGLVAYFMCASIPGDTVTLKYCWSLNGSCEPVRSHSAVPHTRGQQTHYLPLNTAEMETKQHTCRFIADTHTVAFHESWTEGHGQGDYSCGDYCCLLLWQGRWKFCPLPWAAGASWTTPRASVVSKGELKFLLKAPRFQVRKDGRAGEREGVGKTDKNRVYYFQVNHYLCDLFLTAKSGQRKNKNLITVYKCFQKHLGYYESFIFYS